MTGFWFAWYPVKSSDGWVWLRWVYREMRDNNSRCSQLHRWWWEYHK